MAWSGVPRRLAANAGRVLRLASTRRLLGSQERKRWLLVRVGPQTVEQRGPSLPFVPFAFGWGGEERHLSLLETLRLLEAAATDGRLAGVLLRFHGHLPGWSKALALRRAVDSLREAGVKVVAWSESFAAEDYLVASGADCVWLPPSGSLFLVGLRSDHFFLRGLLSKLDVVPEVVRIGSYKGAGEMFNRESMSAEQREQLEAWLDDLYGELIRGIGRGRGLDATKVRARIDDGPYPAVLAREAGLIDGCLYPDEVETQLREGHPSPVDRDHGKAPDAQTAADHGKAPDAQTAADHGKAPDAQTAADDDPSLWLEGADYFRAIVTDAGWRPLGRDIPRVAYVVAGGSIARGAGMRGITSDAFRQIFRQLEKDDRVCGVVLRVDSPGGDAVASDLLYRAVRQLSRKKPVVVSMGEVAASGGYYLAAAADAVYAESGTLTGSIGVVGGKLNLDGLYRRLGVGRESVERGARAGLLSEARGFTPDERGAVRREMEAVYDTFVERVAEGRNLSVDTVKRLGQGRIWSGMRARGHGLVDDLGGPLEALRDVRRRAGLQDGERFLLDLYPRRPRIPGLRALFGSVLPGFGGGSTGI